MKITNPEHVKKQPASFFACPMFTMLQRANRKRVALSLTVGVFLLVMAACKPNGETDALTSTPADASKPTVFTTLEPLTGGIATPMIIEGDNFGTDTARLRVLFVNKKNKADTTRAAIIRSNGKMIYLVVPKLTYKDSLDVVIKVTNSAGTTSYINASRQATASGKPFGSFIYKTENTVTTVAGIPFGSQGDAYTKAGTLSAVTFSNPMFLCVDADKNVIIIERYFGKVPPEMDQGLQPRDENKKNWDGIISLLNEKTKEMQVMKYGGNCNAPAVSPNGLSVYVPFDVGADYYQMVRDDNYNVRQFVFKPANQETWTNGNWKYSFVTNPKDMSKNAYIYTLMYNKQLVKVDPVTKMAEVICKDIGTPFGSDSYLAFNPKEDNVLYVSITNTHSIYRIDLKKDTASTKPYAKPYAGIACVKTKPDTGKDGAYVAGQITNSKFNYPRQITFDDEGVLYIADCVNHCIRSIKIGDGASATPTVDRVVGLAGVKGNVDGGPAIAQLCYPMGIAKAFDGTIYIADTRNYSIKKLVVQ